MFATLLDHPQSIFGGLYGCAKLGCNPWGSFDNMKLWIFCTFGLKMPYSHPENFGFWGIWPPKWRDLSTEPPKAHLCVERHYMTCRSSKSVHPCDLCAGWRDQKIWRRKPYGTVENWVFAQTTHVIWLKYHLAVMMSFKFHQHRLSVYWAVRVELWLISADSIRPWLTQQPCSHTAMTTVLQLSGFCLGQLGWAGTRINIHPLTPIMVINLPLSASSKMKFYLLRPL